MSEKVFDVAVIGAGPAGYVAAIRAADLGASVALVDAGLSGGTCLNVGCIPTKAMLHAGELFSHLAGGTAGLGIHADNIRFDLAELADARDRIVARLRSGLDAVIGQRKTIGRFAAFGRLAGPDTVALFDPAQRVRKTGQLAARSIILASGSRPIRPPSIPFDDRVMTTDEVLGLRRRPERMLVLGGGANGCEQATFFAEIGTQVTLVEALGRILPTLDEDISREVAKGLRKKGVNILVGRQASSIRRDGDGVRSVLDDGSELVTDVVLVVIGRQPNTDDLGLQAAGLETDARGYLRVDDRCRTGVANIYAAGDITGVAPYAHVGYRQGEVAAANALGRDERDDMQVIPAGIFTHPEVATVGLSEDEAAARRVAVKVARFPLQALGIAQAQQQSSGWLKVLFDPGTGRVIGAAAVSPRAAEVIHELALAIRHRLTAEDIVRTIHAHPTYSELVKEAAEHFLGLPIHGLKT